MLAVHVPLYVHSYVGNVEDGQEIHYLSIRHAFLDNEDVPRKAWERIAREGYRLGALRNVGLLWGGDTPQNKPDQWELSVVYEL